MPIEVTRELIDPGRRNRPGTPLKPTSVTIHNTDNPRRGANAKAHSRFVRETGFYILNGKEHWISWHYVVDDQFIIQQVPVNERAWHAGPANASSVAVEICMNSDLDANRAYDNAAALVATLVTDLGLGPDDIVTHQSWTGKDCPTVLLGGDRWQQFLRLVGGHVRSPGIAPAVTGLEADEFDQARETESVEADDAEFDIDHARLRDAVDAILQPD